MRPLDDAFNTPPNRPPRSRPSSTTSRSPSPGLRGLGTSTGPSASGAGGMTYFLTEENNFGVHSMTESHLSPHNTSDNPVESKPETTKKTDKVTAIPPHVFERGHGHTSSIGSIMSPTISTPSSPRQNFSSSAISDDSELELESHGEEETGAEVGDSVTSSFPQLVMPKVNMPRRKAFTEAGRTMGRLKIMVVGDSGPFPLPLIS